MSDDDHGNWLDYPKRSSPIRMFARRGVTTSGDSLLMVQVPVRVVCDDYVDVRLRGFNELKCLPGLC